jgi:hypothetical protein
LACAHLQFVSAHAIEAVQMFPAPDDVSVHVHPFANGTHAEFACTGDGATIPAITGKATAVPIPIFLITSRRVMPSNRPSTDGATSISFCFFSCSNANQIISALALDDISRETSSVRSFTLREPSHAFQIKAEVSFKQKALLDRRSYIRTSPFAS